MYVIPQTPRASGELSPPGPPTRALPSTRWGPKSGPQTPRLPTNPGSAPDIHFVSVSRSCICVSVYIHFVSVSRSCICVSVYRLCLCFSFVYLCVSVYPLCLYFSFVYLCVSVSTLPLFLVRVFVCQCISRGGF
jgi:hypothetical protein